MASKNIILVIENILGLYRNYWFFGKVPKVFIIIRLIFELSLILACVVVQLHHDAFVTIESMYFFIHAFNSMFVMVFTIFQSKTFKKLFKLRLLFFTYFSNSEKHEYLRKTNARTRLLLVLMIINNILQVIPAIVIYVRVAKSDQKTFLDFEVFMILLFQGLYYVCNFRLILEFFLISWSIFDISDQLNGIIRSINVKIYKMKQQGDLRIDSTKNAECLKIIDKWSAAYTTVEKITKSSNVMFGLQIALMLVIVVTIYIILLYGIVILSIEGPILSKYIYGVSLVQFLLALWMLSLAAQTATNRARQLRRSLSTLLHHTLDCEIEYKATRDLLRLVDSHPIRIKALGIDVDMALLPTCVALCTTYTVICLQFTNVV